MSVCVRLETSTHRLFGAPSAIDAWSTSTDVASFLVLAALFGVVGEFHRHADALLPLRRTKRIGLQARSVLPIFVRAWAKSNVRTNSFISAFWRANMLD